MKRSGIFVIAGVSAIACLAAGCGSKSSSKIASVTVAAESIQAETTVANASASDVYSADDSAPGADYVRSSLTNEWVKKDVANSRPIAVMMPTDSEAQPQYRLPWPSYCRR